MTRELTDFYGATVSRLVGQLSLVTGDRGAAEELVQEAFVRLVPRWSRVSRYEDPEAWVRGAAMRLATNRWHRARTAAAHLRSARAPEPAAGPDASDVDLHRALAALPVGQRQVVVLHHLVGLPVDEVARELGVAPGTVKSRLSRGRAALAVLLAESDEGALA